MFCKVSPFQTETVCQFRSTQNKPISILLILETCSKLSSFKTGAICQFRLNSFWKCSPHCLHLKLQQFGNLSRSNSRNVLHVVFISNYIHFSTASTCIRLVLEMISKLATFIFILHLFNLLLKCSPNWLYYLPNCLHLKPEQFSPHCLHLKLQQFYCIYLTCSWNDLQIGYIHFSIASI
jgi:hypothetical protein